VAAVFGVVEKVSLIRDSHGTSRGWVVVQFGAFALLNE
jgi:hypothetical protein